MRNLRFGHLGHPGIWGVTLLFCLASCGGETAVGSSAAASQPVPTANSTGASTSSSGNPTAAKPATGKPIIIGALADVTGSFALNGAEIHLATDMAVAQINATGGINGHPLQVTYADPKSDPAQAIALATQLVQQDNVDVLVGAVGSAECAGVEQLAGKLGVVYVTQAGCAAEEITSKTCNLYTFRFIPAGRQTIEPLAAYLVKSIGKRWAVLYSDYAFGQSQLTAYDSAMAKAGGSIVTKIAIPLGEANVDGYVSKVPTDGSVDGAVASFSGADEARVAGALQRFGINTKMPVVGAGTKEHYAGVYPALFTGDINAATVMSAAPPGNKFAADFDQLFKAQAAKDAEMAKVVGGPDKAVAGQSGYPAYTAITGLKLAMVASNFSGKADTAKLITALEKLNVPLGPEFPYGGMVMSPTDHQGSSTEYVYKINGQNEELLQTIPADQVPAIGTCKVS